MKFEVGERVQFIFEGKLQSGVIMKLEGELVDIDLDMDKVRLYTTIDDIIKLDQPEPVVVPKETADFIKTYGSSNDRYSVLATIMKDIINCYSPDTDDLFTESLEKNIQAVLDGYVVEEDQGWVVGVIDSDRDNEIFYFRGFDSSREIFNFYVERRSEAYKFTEKEKAEAVALLIGGTVEEVEASE